MAEPFGLFQILQSFLSQNTQNATPPPNSETENADEKNAAPITAEENGATVSETENAVAERERAVLDFMQAHDVRAKRIKKS